MTQILSYSRHWQIYGVPSWAYSSNWIKWTHYLSEMQEGRSFSLLNVTNKTRFFFSFSKTKITVKILKSKQRIIDVTRLHWHCHMLIFDLHLSSYFNRQLKFENLPVDNMHAPKHLSRARELNVALWSQVDPAAKIS